MFVMQPPGWRELERGWRASDVERVAALALFWADRGCGVPVTCESATVTTSFLTPKPYVLQTRKPAAVRSCIHSLLPNFRLRS